MTILNYYTVCISTTKMWVVFDDPRSQISFIHKLIKHGFKYRAVLGEHDHAILPFGVIVDEYIKTVRLFEIQDIMHALQALEMQTMKRWDDEWRD